MNQSKQIFERAKKVIPGGVNSPVRAFKSVGLDPIFIESGKGVHLKDVDGNEYLDYICSWGPLIMGHSNEKLFEGIEKVLYRGTSYGVPCELEVEMAEAIVDAYPSVELVRMVNSGTEATMSALRVARAYTKRNKILKFEGCYHGHSDALLVKSGSGTLTFGVPTSPGVPEDVVKDTLVGKFNDVEGLKAIFEQNKNQIAAVILEPVAGNMGVIRASEEFISTLREITEAHGTVLIFDEVITGFRLDYGGAQAIYDIEADMTCFGKIIGGGLPVGAYGGKKEIMSMVSPVGSVYQAGTLSGNPLAMHMGLQTLKQLKAHPEYYDHMEQMAIRMEKGIAKIIKANDYPVSVTREKGMVCLFFAEGPFISYDDVKRCDTEAFGKYFRGMMDEGILLPPAQFEGYFISTEHSEEDIDKTLRAIDKVLKTIY
jgi:glutamate-1-semialdehyde 2,1-aminomutase